MKNLWLKISCALTGWNYDILIMCTEASRKQLKKYSAALVIIMVIWGLIGYLFADRYVKLDWYGSLIVAITMIVVVLQIERQIILTVGNLGWLKTFRMVIAIVMAIIGSAIVDQIIFKDDIEKEMIVIVDNEVKELLPNRLSVIDNEFNRVKMEIDTLEKINLALYEEVKQQPTINTVYFVTEDMIIQKSEGGDSIVRRRKPVENPVENPKYQQINTNNKNLEALRVKQDTLISKKMHAETDLRAELNDKKGFLMELRAILNIIFDRTEALIFYVLLFVFLASLELFVVFSKMGDHKCDYDVNIEEMQSKRIKELQKP